MLSIDNTYSGEELREFDQRIKHRADIDKQQDIEYVVELKIDGIAITLWYEHGLLREAPPEAMALGATTLLQI